MIKICISVVIFVFVLGFVSATKVQKGVSRYNNELAELKQHLQSSLIEVFVPTQRAAVEDKKLKKIGEIKKDDVWRKRMENFSSSAKIKRNLHFVSPKYYLKMTSEDNMTTRIYGLNISKESEKEILYLDITRRDASRVSIKASHDLLENDNYDNINDLFGPLKLMDKTNEQK